MTKILFFSIFFTEMETRMFLLLQNTFITQVLSVFLSQIVYSWRCLKNALKWKTYLSAFTSTEPFIGNLDLRNERVCFLGRSKTYA